MIRKKDIEAITKRLDALEKKPEAENITDSKATKECEVCHGIFAEWVTGKSEIRERDCKDAYLMVFPIKEEYIHHPIYCHRCAPKKPAKKAAKKSK